MQFSRFNYMFSSSCGSFIYNSVTNSFVKISKQLKDRIESIREWNEDSMGMFSPELQKLLLEHKIIVKDGEDNDYVLLKRYAKLCSAFSQKSLGLTIATTTGCNFACPYCFEKGTEAFVMNEDVEKRVVELVNNSISTSLFVTWYGGEPLLNFETIKRLTECFSKIERLDHIGYSLITNGYYLTQDKIVFFKSHNLQDVQVTIDGLPAMHDRLRKAKNGTPTFDVIVSNVLNAASQLPRCRFNIRVNISKKNSEQYTQLVALLKEKWKGAENIHPYHAFVEDYGNCDVSCLNNEEKSDFVKLQTENGIISAKSLLPKSTLGVCMANSLNSFLIAPNGDVYKCWSDLGRKERMVASLMDDKSKNYLLLAHYAIDMDKMCDPRCEQCFLFPVCEGGCPQHRYTTAKGLQKHGTCSYQSTMLDSILEMIYSEEKDNVKS